MRRHFWLASLLAVTCGAVSSSFSAGHDSNTALIVRYQRETSELAKRDLALKMIDSGVLKLNVTTSKEVANIFGVDWMPDTKTDQYESVGMVLFAKQPKAPPNAPGHDEPDVAVPFIGWYLIIHYNTKNQVVFAWEISNVHK